MRFAKPIHWAEGLFLEPQHLQRSQSLMQQQAWQTLSLSLPYAYGLIDLEIDEEALSVQRIVINKLSAVMPDGTYISMPGNCHIEPLQLNVTALPDIANGLMICLSLPSLSSNEGNLGEKHQSGRYGLSAETMLDENTGDNEVSLILREYNARLIVLSPQHSNARDTLLPICKVRCPTAVTTKPTLQLDKNYIPPFIVLSESCPLLNWAAEFLFMLKNCRVNLESDIESDGFDSKLVTGSDILRLNQLAALNSFIERAENFLQPMCITPFALCLELCDLLGRLSVLNPLQHVRTSQYQHENYFPVFKELSQRIRSLLNKEHTSQSLGRLDFAFDEQGYFGVFNLEDKFFRSGTYFLALSFDGELKEKIPAIENGDNFRLLDIGSFKDRIRGIKLVHLRYPPHFLPNLNHTLWFKLMIDDSLRVWNYILEERSMVIDFAPPLFEHLKASLYFSTEQNM